MPKKRGQGLRNFDDALHIVTGMRMKDIARSFFNSFGDELTKKVSKKAAEFFTMPDEVNLPDDSPYCVLGINPDAPDFLVKAAYRSFAKHHHPDIGGNPEEFKKVQEAYERICIEREMSK